MGLNAVILSTPYLIFLGATTHPVFAKTGFGLVDWARERCAGQWRLPGGTVDLGLPDLDAEAAAVAGLRTLVIGVAPSGGRIEPAWIAAVVRALDAGLDVASGMHSRLQDAPEIRAAAERSGGRLHNVRFAEQRFDVGTGIKRPGKRLLTVGTDCAVGKKYTVLALEKEMRARGLSADYRATGQTGILIAGRGVAIDAVVSDFVAGAAEWLSPSNEPDHWDLVEGQGSLFHPGYAAVTLGLIHGSQPDAIVVCHEAGRDEIDDAPGFATPSLETCIEANLAAARLTNPAVRCAGVSINTSRLDPDARAAYLAEVSRRLALPAVDPIATGTAALVDHLVERF